MNYYDTFIEVAPDCPVTEARVPVLRGRSASVAVLQYELLSNNPYRYTQEELIFEVQVRRKGIPPDEVEGRREELWAELFRKPHACLRASPLPKTYGWGLHFDAKGRTALYGLESEEYNAFVEGGRDNVKLLSAFRSKRA